MSEPFNSPCIHETSEKMLQYNVSFEASRIDGSFRRMCDFLKVPTFVIQEHCNTAGSLMLFKLFESTKKFCLSLQNVKLWLMIRNTQNYNLSFSLPSGKRTGMYFVMSG